MITIIFAPPRTGKTCLMTYIACEKAFDRERNKLMTREIINKQNNGFKNRADYNQIANYVYTQQEINIKIFLVYNNTINNIFFMI